jgi:hypothetical protein
MTRMKIAVDSNGRYEGLNIVCHAGHTHFIITDWTPPGMVRSPHYSGPNRWHFNGNFSKPTIAPSVRTRAGHYGREPPKKGDCYCDYAERFPDKEPMPEKWGCYQCHFVLTDGMIWYCNDCSHEFKDKTLSFDDSQEKSTMPPTPHPNAGYRERTPVRFVQKIRTEAYWRVYWTDKENLCKDGRDFHDALNLIDVGPLHDHTFAKHRELILPNWPTKCERCERAVPNSYEQRYAKPYETTAHYHIFYQEIFNTASGRPEPGDLYYEDLCLRLKDRDTIPGICHQTHKAWTNCDGIHLHGVLPSGHVWDIDSRCNNCLSPDDTEHRCWIRHGRPELGELITVDKNGKTCRAGGGSIDCKARGNLPAWHGFLKYGEWVR